MLIIFSSLWYAFMRNEVVIDGGYLLMAKMCCAVFQFLAFSVPLEAAFISCFSHLPHSNRMGFLRFLHGNRKEVSAWFGGALRHLLPGKAGKDAMLLLFFLLWQSMTMWMGFTLVGAAWLHVLPVLMLPALLFVPGEAYLIVMICRCFARLAGK